MAPRKPEAGPGGLLPADPKAALDPVALYKTLSRAATPLSKPEASALVRKANKRCRRAAAARKKLHHALSRAITQVDWGHAGELFAAQQRDTLQRAVSSGLVPRPAHPALSGGRKPGALDPLGTVLKHILEPDPYMVAKDVLAALKDMARKKHNVVIAVRRKRLLGDVVVWHHPGTGRQETLWTSIQGGRLTRIRKLLKAPQRSRAPR